MESAHASVVVVHAVADAMVSKVVAFACTRVLATRGGVTSGTAAAAPRQAPAEQSSPQDTSEPINQSTLAHVYTADEVHLATTAYVADIMRQAIHHVPSLARPTPEAQVDKRVSSPAALPLVMAEKTSVAVETTRQVHFAVCISRCTSRRHRKAPDGPTRMLECSAVSLFEETTDDATTSFPNIITELAIYPVSSDMVESETPRRRAARQRAKLKPVVVVVASSPIDTPPQIALVERTKLAAEVYLPGDPDALKLVKQPPSPRPHLQPPPAHPPLQLEPIVFKGGKYKPYAAVVAASPSSATHSPRVKKLEQTTTTAQQYGSPVPPPTKRPPHPQPAATLSISTNETKPKMTPGQVSGFCRQCLLVGDMCKLADCREHNYFPKLTKPPTHGRAAAMVKHHGGHHHPK
ncbi:Aste57867_13972 [Aphanomyces stellatus]|uniref:Aste57867_13972 protein n=1 Tax=Aphanomyces stellatus TaxID=120398 RepID=A0A485KZG9_9STRA|nr:hypothetical protein As57867_013921 [Aphanomyces stellatus]VFT90802.1 Aste57867_13972 [Aphanomyces stellatus]